ncbi:sensor domain-containing diguanylate cyclase [Billgrantia kenyensis]|uniref:diguanylate cyclase n=1 Tax=Billgrantia kenyensis TaxID=321266 RepID=A0A7W0AFD3_9GAMM|nr:diguanylate cyclase [Halomonas kenyensis]MBA2781073.1 diguanylate cyclase [Halomonas kenyensis]MCG6663780.1 diguanylate cyclase [Halomonas kenyensis]
MKEISVNRDPAELRQMLDFLGIAAFVIDVVSPDEYRLAAINARHEKHSGMKHDEVAGRSVDDVLSPAMAARVKVSYRRCVKSKTAIDYQETLDLPIGRTYWLTTLVPFFDEAGTVTRLLGTAYEISDQMHLELEARYQSTVMSAYLDESTDGILVVGSNNRIKTWNRRFLEIWNIPQAVMDSRDGDAALQAVVEQVRQPDSFVRRIRELYSSLGEEEQGVRIEMRDGRVLERYSRGLHGPDGSYWGRIWFYRDVTELQRMTERLVHLSQTDPLTGIPNRRVLMQQLEEEYGRARRYGHSLSVLMLDLDHFKQINDCHGHASGDLVLMEFVMVISPEIRASDCFARMGGEEFAILLPQSSLTSARRLAERLCRHVAGLSFTSQQGQFGVTVSIGVATLEDNDTSPEQLLSRADQGLYVAKASGRNRVHTSRDAARPEGAA